MPDILAGDLVKLFYMLDLYLPLFMCIVNESYPYHCGIDGFIERHRKSMTRYLIMKRLFVMPLLNCTYL